MLMDMIYHNYSKNKTHNPSNQSPTVNHKTTGDYFMLLTTTFLKIVLKLYILVYSNYV